MQKGSSGSFVDGNWCFLISIELECNETCRFWQNCVRPHLTDIKTNKSYYLRCLIDLFHRKSLFWLRKKTDMELCWPIDSQYFGYFCLIECCVWCSKSYSFGIKCIAQLCETLYTEINNNFVLISLFHDRINRISIAVNATVNSRWFFLCCCRMKFSWLIVCFKRQWKRNITRLWWNHDYFIILSIIFCFLRCRWICAVRLTLWMNYSWEDFFCGCCWIILSGKR